MLLLTARHPQKCFVKGCGKKHHTMLHEHYVGERQRDEVTPSREKPTKENGTTKFTGLVKSPKVIYLQIVPVKLIGSGGKFVHTYALLDTGSQSNLIRADIARRLNLSGKKKHINITTVKDEPDMITVKEISLDIESMDGRAHLKVRSAYVVPPGKFNMPAQPPPPPF